MQDINKIVEAQLHDEGKDVLDIVTENVELLADNAQLKAMQAYVREEMISLRDRLDDFPSIGWHHSLAGWIYIMKPTQEGE